METRTAMQKKGVRPKTQTLPDDFEVESLEDEIKSDEAALDDDIDDIDGIDIDIDDIDVDDIDIDEIKSDEDKEDTVEKVKIYDDNGVEITLALDNAEEEDLSILEEKTNVLSSNPFTHYLTDLTKYKLLTKEEEAMYGERVQAAIEEGRVDYHARDMLINSNLRLVISVSRRYVGAGGNIGIGDLVAWGNVGLMEAVNKFKPEYGYRFSTYATWWIKQAVQRKIADIRSTIRKPVHMFQLEYRYKKLIDKLEPGQTLSDEEIAEKINCSLNQLANVREAINVVSVSLNLPTSNGDGEDMGELLDTIVDPDGERADTQFFNNEMLETVERLLIKLNEREATVLKFRFGINCSEHTLEETGRHFGVTRERVRQIECMALKKLRRYILMDEKDIKALI
jgi:RNA polymerase primary sigma factor